MRMMWAKQRQAGFTIVELLIVIVVIGILAAITVVAYSGFQQRARNTQVIAGVNAYVKAIESYKALNGSYPAITGCLGANYPNNRCWDANGAADKAVNTTLDAQLSEFIPNKPTLATQLMDLGLVSPNYYQRAGLVYLYNSATFIEMRYYLAGNNQNCTVAGFTFTNEGSLSNCSKLLSN